jgi:hypothetical protein
MANPEFHTGPPPARLRAMREAVGSQTVCADLADVCAALGELATELDVVGAAPGVSHAAQAAEAAELAALELDGDVLGRVLELVPCEACDGLEALCTECGGRGATPAPRTIKALEEYRTAIDAGAERLELAREAAAEALEDERQARRVLLIWARTLELTEAAIDVALAAAVHVDR